MPHSPVTATLSDEDDGFMDLLDGENLKVLCVCVFPSILLTTLERSHLKRNSDPPTGGYFYSFVGNLLRLCF